MKEKSAFKKHKTRLRLILYFWGTLHWRSCTELSKAESPVFSDEQNISYLGVWFSMEGRAGGKEDKTEQEAGLFHSDTAV